MRTFEQARSMLVAELCARGINDTDALLADAEAVLCEDFQTVMLYASCPTEPSGWVCKYFDLPARVDSIDAAAIENALIAGTTWSSSGTLH